MKKQVKIGLGAAALALAAALCAGGTLAGWRTSSTVTNHISTATVQGIVEEKYEQGQTITPGQTVEKCVWVKNTGTASSLVRAKVVIDWDDETAADMDATDCVFPAYNTADWTQGEDGYWYYNDIVCLQGLVIALSCVIFSALAASPPSVDTSASVVTAVWTYVAELTFNLLVLVGAIKGCDRIVKEIMGL